MNYPPIPSIPYNPTLSGIAEMLPEIVYSTANEKPLKLHILSPWRNKEEEKEPPKNPLIVFIQGSGWTSPKTYYEIPQLSEYARKGYVVATVSHRNSTEGHPFPAFLQDVKTAIRFLRKNASEYGIDPDRVAAFGTSSGGNTALLLGITGDDPAFQTAEHAEFSDSVKTVISCFGPTELLRLVDERIKNNQGAASNAKNILYHLCGGPAEENTEILRAMSPYWLLEEGKEYPPFFLLHGDADPGVPYSQSEIMYQKLLDYKADAQMLCIENGPHEGSFWSQEVHNRVQAFLEKTL